MHAVRIVRLSVGALCALALVYLSMPAAAGAQEPVPQAGDPQGVLVDSVVVRGNEHVTAEAIGGTAGIASGERVTAAEIQRAIHRLMGTERFDQVEILARGDPEESVTLVIQVDERPFVTAFRIEGLERIRERDVRDTVDITADAMITPTHVAEITRMIRDLLADRGVQAVGIDTRLEPLDRPEGAFEIVFEVEEGHRLAIAEVEIRGNEVFSDGTLRRQMSTRPEGFFWFRQGRLDRQVLDEDLNRRLPDFYQSRGYIDFTVVGDTLIVDPGTGKARLEIDVEEGPQYRIAEFDVQGNRRFPTDRILDMLVLERRTILGLPVGPRVGREYGDVFDAVAVRDVAQQLNQLYRNEGFLYAQVQPRVERRSDTTDQGEPLVDVVLEVVEGNPFHINRIEIAGNTRTHESVIRDRIFLLPGQLYNEDRLLQSYQAISGLGFFETPLPMPEINPDPESGEVDVVFHVEEQQTGSINFGTTFGGFGSGITGFLGFTQPNLFGRGKQAEVRAEYGWRSIFQATYSDPALFESRYSGTVSLFHTQDRFQTFRSGRRTITGGSVRFGIPLLGMRFTRGFVGYSLSRNRYTAFDDEDADPDNIFLLPAATASTLTTGVTRDTKNHPIFPTTGVRQSINLDQTGGLLGGDGNFQKLRGEMEWWVPAGRIGGDQPGERPIMFTLGVRGKTGAIFGDASRFPLEQFYMGGTQDGIQLRGYEEGSITPFGHRPSGAGVRDQNRLGSAFVLLSAEYAMRLNDNVSIYTFADAGNLWTETSLIDPTRLMRGAGVGVTLVTPFGPIGLDYGYGFDRVDARGNPDPGWQFHFRLGPGM